MSTCVIDIHMVDEKIRYPALAYQCCFLFHGSSGQRVVSIPEWMRQITEHFYQGAAAFSIEQGDMTKYYIAKGNNIAVSQKSGNTISS